jgi:hypothetical protein
MNHIPLPATFELPHRSPWRRRIAIFVGVACAAALTLAVWMFAARRGASADPSGGVLRVVLKSESGTGFVVRGPDELAYVVTAHHVIASGEPIVVEHAVDQAGGPTYVEALPEVDVVAFDTSADLAVLRLRNVRADHFRAFALAKAPRKDEPILSYGYPASNLSNVKSMMSKTGKVLDLVKFPAYDHSTGTIVRQDAADGVLISAEIEPGFSGGPTCNDRGEVVGVNVTKDLAHRAQNGVVSVVELRRVLAQVKPASSAAPVTATDVHALLARVQTELLQLPLDRRASVIPHDYVADSDLPRIGELVTELRILENDASRDPKTKLSGAALLGVVLARLPGRSLETYTSSTTHAAIAACELRRRGLQDFFGRFATDGAVDALASDSDCAMLAVRPLVWDLAALALQWEGKVRDASVVKVETVDGGRHDYRAQVRFGDGPIVDVWVSTEGGVLRLKLFDNKGMPTAIASAHGADSSAFAGTWHRTEPRTLREAGNVEVGIATDETLVLSVGATGDVFATHDLRRHLSRDTVRIPCGNGSTLELGLEQSFSGRVDNGSIVAFRHADAKALGGDMARCGRALTYAPDQAAVFKIVGDKLVMYRTDGTAFPEAAEFQR